MRTSPRQFEAIVKYMEQHGDLSRCSMNPSATGRLSVLMNWEELTQVLNADESGDKKSTDKWRKVWSDFKNNTKKKALRLKANNDHGNAKLTDLEVRVLKICAAELLLPKKAQNELQDEETQNSETIYLEAATDNQEPEPSERRIHIKVESENAESDQEVEETFLDNDSCNETDLPNDTRRSPFHPYRRPKPSQRPFRRPLKRFMRARGYKKFFADPESAFNFLQSDQQWRELQEQTHEDELEMKRENIRIRHLEIQTQRKWQLLASRFIDLTEKVVNYVCQKKN